LLTTHVLNLSVCLAVSRGGENPRRGFACLNPDRVVGPFFPDRSWNAKVCLTQKTQKKELTHIRFLCETLSSLYKDGHEYREPGRDWCCAAACQVLSKAQADSAGHPR